MFIMLEVGKRYSKIELNAIFGECSVQSMIRKLNRYQVDVQVFGRGEKAQFKILEIGDPFKLFCITELDFDANTDFDKLQYFYYYFFNDDEFAAMPDEEKARQMNDRGCPVGRQTIANYIRKLEQNVWIAKDTENCIYYFARGSERRIVTKEEYKTAWKEYWEDKNNGASSEDAIINMRSKYYGIARKNPIPRSNAFFLNDIEQLCNLIQIRMEQQIINK